MARMKTVTLEEFTFAFTEILDDYHSKVRLEANKVMLVYAYKMKEEAEALSRPTARNIAHLQDGWRVKIIQKDQDEAMFIVHNVIKAGVPHLLEFGTARARAFPVLTPAFNKYEKEMFSKLGTSIIKL